MDRDEILERLESTRAVFDEKVAAVPAERLESQIPGHVHSVAEIVWHVAAYDDLMVRRLRAARQGVTTEFDRDRVGWEHFNERVWDEAADKSGTDAMAFARVAFEELTAEVAKLDDAECNESVGIVQHLDPAWLDGRALWELIAIDGFDHYPMHYEQLDLAAAES